MVQAAAHPELRAAAAPAAQLNSSVAAAALRAMSDERPLPAFRHDFGAGAAGCHALELVLGLRVPWAASLQVDSLATKALFTECVLPPNASLKRTAPFHAAALPWVNGPHEPPGYWRAHRWEWFPD